MKYCFVHAPNSDGWNGELVLALRKNRGDFRLHDVQIIMRDLYPNDDVDSWHYDNNVSENKIAEYLTRKEKGFMQRRSIYGTYEDLHFDEWEKSMIKKYPNIFWLYNPAKKNGKKNLGN